MKSALVLLVLLVFVGCDGSNPTPDEVHTKTILVWRGASAEQIRDELLVLPLLRLAVVYDGEATLYHQTSEREVIAELDQARKHWSDEIQLSKVQTYDGTLPEPPNLKTEQGIAFHAKPEVMSQFGITFSDLAEQMGDVLTPSGDDLILSPSDGDLAKKIITTPNGLAVPLEDLGTIESVEVTRPLIIEMTGP